MTHNLELIQSTYFGNKYVGDEIVIGFSTYVVIERTETDTDIKHIITLK